MLENWLAKPGNQWEGWEVCEGSAKVKFLSAAMETWSCKYGFILLVHLWPFYVSKGVILSRNNIGKVAPCVVHNKL